MSYDRDSLVQNKKDNTPLTKINLENNQINLLFRSRILIVHVFESLYIF